MLICADTTIKSRSNAQYVHKVLLQKSNYRPTLTSTPVQHQLSVIRRYIVSHVYIDLGERPFKCDICGHGSTTRGARARHKRIHTGEKNHACDLCPMRFAVAFALRNHRRTHTGEKPYACDQCDRRFTQRTEMVWHQKSHIGKKKLEFDHFVHIYTINLISLW